MARKNIISIGNLGVEANGQNMNAIINEKLKEGLNFKEIVASIEKELIATVLKQTNWNRTKTAEKLQIHRRLLYSKMKEYEL